MMLFRLIGLGVLLLPVAGFSETLIDFGEKEAVPGAQGHGASISLVQNEFGPALGVSTRSDHRWPAVQFNYPNGLDLSRHGKMVFSVKNNDPETLQVHCQIQSRPKGSTGKDQTVVRKWRIMVESERQNTFYIPLIPMDENLGAINPDDYFGMRGIPFVNSKPMHLEHITQISVFVVNEGKLHQFEISNLELKGDPFNAAKVPENPFPMIDEFGQFIHGDWPLKVHSRRELFEHRDQEIRFLKKTKPPAEWNSYGGWAAGPQREATGFFRTEKLDGKWYLVDPEGRLFFSLGINCVGYGGYTTLDDREHWFAWLPQDNHENRKNGLYRNYRSHMPNYYYGDRKVRTFNFRQLNLMRKYGENWEQTFFDVSTRRLSAWGINTIASWSDPKTYAFKRVPYTHFVHLGRSVDIQGSEGYWGQFKDVFDPSFKEGLQTVLGSERVQKMVNDPWCIGYFVGNEITWGDETSLAIATLRSPATQAAKQVMLEDLKNKYGFIEKLNRTWQTEHASWKALLDCREVPDKQAAEKDLLAFNERIVRKYFKTIQACIRAAAPNQLYLGCRLAWSNPMVSRIAGEFCDVVSFNAYTSELPAKFEMFAEAGDVPCMIGEFHFGALDRGPLHPGLIPVQDQEERAEAFTQYVMDALGHPNLVGCHWFQYSDSPTTGRCLDGENYQIGFTDTCDTPYPELIKASRVAAEQMYTVRFGALQEK